MLKLPDKFILYHHSLDSYLFLRFLRTVIFICLVGCALTWPTLMPVNATGGGASSQLDMIGIGNVEKTHYLYAHAILAWVFSGFVMFTVARERLWLIGLRQAWKLSKSNSERLSSRIILFVSAPRDALLEANKIRYFGDAAVRVWPSTKIEALETMVSERDSLVEKLENAEMSLITEADKHVRKSGENNPESSNSTYSNLDRDLKESLRPKRRFQQKGNNDEITWLREKLKEKIKEIDNERNAYELGKPHGAASVFVEFKTQADAQQAAQQITSTNVLAFAPRYNDVPPSDVIWQNLSLSPSRRASQEAMAWAIVAALILFWSIPSGLIGLISNISYLAENFKWLGFLNRLPDSVIGLLSGLLPPLATSALSKYVPNLFRCGWLVR